MEDQKKPVRQRRPTPVASNPPRLEKSDQPALEELTENTEEDISSSELENVDNPAEEEYETKNSTSGYKWIFTVGIVLVLIGILIHSNIQYSALSKDQKEYLKTKFKEMTQKYKNQPYETWHLLKHEMLSSEPSIITLLYMDKNVAECLANQLGNLALEANNTRKIIKLKSADLAKNKVNFVEQYKPKLEENGVLIVSDIGLLSGKQALGLHSFSDNLNPIVRKTVIIFTLKDDGLMMREKPNKRATHIMEKLWKDIKVELLAPLVTRLVNSVVEIKPEANFNCS